MMIIQIPGGRDRATGMDRDQMLIRDCGYSLDDVKSLGRTELRAEIADTLGQRRYSDYHDVHPILRAFYFVKDVIEDFAEYISPTTELDAHLKDAAEGRNIDSY